MMLLLSLVALSLRGGSYLLGSFKTRNKISWYKCIQTYTLYMYVFSLCIWIAPNVWLGRLYFLIWFHLPVLLCPLHRAVCWLSPEGPQHEDHPFWVQGVAFDASQLNIWLAGLVEASSGVLSSSLLPQHYLLKPVTPVCPQSRDSVNLSRNY